VKLNTRISNKCCTPLKYLRVRWTTLPAPPFCFTVNPNKDGRIPERVKSFKIQTMQTQWDPTVELRGSQREERRRRSQSKAIDHERQQVARIFFLNELML
jgi:hypothetical protein